MQQIEIIKIKKVNNTFILANYLNYVLSTIKIIHWYTLNVNLHEIFGDLYQKLNVSFDNLQEEIIGLNRQQTCLNLNPNFFLINQSIDELIENDLLIIDFYKKMIVDFKNILCSEDFNNFINSSNSGLNNSKEEILLQINKSLYLISLVKL
jgi:hypothetical protein